MILRRVSANPKLEGCNTPERMSPRTKPLGYLRVLEMNPYRQTCAPEPQNGPLLAGTTPIVHEKDWTGKRGEIAEPRFTFRSWDRGWGRFIDRNDERQPLELGDALLAAPIHNDPTRRREFPQTNADLPIRVRTAWQDAP